MGFYTIESSIKPKFKAKSEKSAALAAANTSIFSGFNAKIQLRTRRI